MVSARQLADVCEVQISEFQSNREGGAYIDTYNFDDHEESDDDDDVDEEDDLYDEYHDSNRVEDEPSFFSVVMRVIWQACVLTDILKAKHDKVLSE